MTFNKSLDYVIYIIIMKALIISLFITFIIYPVLLICKALVVATKLDTAQLSVSPI